MTGPRALDVTALAEEVCAGDRRALANAITIVESTRPDHRVTAEKLLGMLPGPDHAVMRIGISGAPGVGKSTLIDGLGRVITADGTRLAVLAIDPSSARTGGSILGDKTRMIRLSRSADVFIRPSPAGTSLGGVARRTREVMHICEAAGFTRILIETVGVGQSETAVAQMTDVFTLVVAPGGGDALQGIKRGIMELADLVVVNKADGDLAAAAQRAVAEYRSALTLMIPRHEGQPAQALAVSALEDTGLDDLWDALRTRFAGLAATGALDRQRADQARQAMWSDVREQLLDMVRADTGPDTRALEEEVAAGRLLPHLAAARILDRYHRAAGPLRRPGPPAP